VLSLSKPTRMTNPPGKRTTASDSFKAPPYG
jgi:hypothetical protein